MSYEELLGDESTYLRYRCLFRCWWRDVRRNIKAEKQLPKWQIERSRSIPFILEIVIHNNAVLSAAHQREEGDGGEPLTQSG